MSTRSPETTTASPRPGSGRRASRTRRTFLLAMVGCLAVGASAACSKSETTGGTTGGTGGGGGGGNVAVRVGYFPNVTHAPALVAKQKGLFESKLKATGATFEGKTFNAGPAAVEALFNDALDISYIGPNPSINAYQKSNGEAVRVISGSTSGGAAFVVKPEIASAADLKGKTVASPQLGNTQDVALRTWLKGQGLSTDTSGGGDVSIKPQENADTLTAFKDGNIVGAWVPEPWVTRLLQEGGGKVLVDEKTIWPEGKFVTTNIIVRTAFLKEHPDQVKAVLEAHLEAVELIEKDGTETQKLANKEIEVVTQKPLADKVIADAWKNLTFTFDPVASSLQKSADDALALGQLKSADVKNIYDLSILNGLLKAKGKPEVKGLS